MLPVIVPLIVARVQVDVRVDFIITKLVYRYYSALLIELDIGSFAIICLHECPLLVHHIATWDCPKGNGPLELGQLWVLVSLVVETACDLQVVS